jgi:hypothetical protein
MAPIMRVVFTQRFWMWVIVLERMNAIRGSPICPELDLCRVIACPLSFERTTLIFPSAISIDSIHKHVAEKFHQDELSL